MCQKSTWQSIPGIFNKYRKSIWRARLYIIQIVSQEFFRDYLRSCEGTLTPSPSSLFRRLMPNNARAGGLNACFVVIKKYRTVCCSVKTNKGRLVRAAGGCGEGFEASGSGRRGVCSIYMYICAYVCVRIFVCTFVYTGEYGSVHARIQKPGVSSC